MPGQRIGYIRVSSFDQNPERQLENTALDRVFTDKASGKDMQRPELDRLLAFVREGDTVVVHSMDRLARNLDDLHRLVQSLTKRGVAVQFLKENMTFTGIARQCAVKRWSGSSGCMRLIELHRRPIHSPIAETDDPDRILSIR